MSIDEIRRNTRRLWTLINNRDVSSNVSIEIENLVDQGIDVNFRDSQRNYNTALHSAIERNDLKCVDFLLSLRPDLNIKNDSNETSENLFNNIKVRRKMMKNLLVSHNYTIRNQEFSYEIHNERNRSQKNQGVQDESGLNQENPDVCVKQPPVIISMDRQQLQNIQNTNEFGDNFYLLNALESKNFENLSILLDQGIDVTQNSKYANKAVEHSNFDFVLLLLLHDSPFPESFDIKQLDDSVASQIQVFIDGKLFIFLEIFE
jgi:hypothetical protein